MLEQLLTQISSGRNYTLATLAASLDVSEDLLEQMMDDLERAGYVSVADMGAASGCKGHCDGCPSSGLCALVHGKRIWALTPKGRHAAW